MLFKNYKRVPIHKILSIFRGLDGERFCESELKTLASEERGSEKKKTPINEAKIQEKEEFPHFQLDELPSGLLQYGPEHQQHQQQQ